VNLATFDCNPGISTGEIFPDDFRFGPTTKTDDFICWTIERFKGWRTAFTTSFGMEGCALIDMYARRGVPLEVTYFDTMFFFPETHELIDRMRERYPKLSFVNRGTTITAEQQSRQFGPELWKSDPDLCCKLRKVEPLRELMKRTDIWIAGLRRSQSETRARVEMVEWDPRFNVLKLNPLAFWDRTDVWRYVRENDVPYNALHERGYPTVGCTHCTRAVAGATPDQYTRLGRWSGSDKTECGLHFAK
jgi:phosphoadenosine phosphosulfate reductase